MIIVSTSRSEDHTNATCALHDICAGGDLKGSLPIIMHKATGAIYWNRDSSISDVSTQPCIVEFQSGHHTIIVSTSSPTTNTTRAGRLSVLGL